MSDQTENDFFQRLHINQLMNSVDETQSISSQNLRREEFEIPTADFFPELPDEDALQEVWNNSDVSIPGEEEAEMY
jgi:hypothetical protein